MMRLGLETALSAAFGAGAVGAAADWPGLLRTRDALRPDVVVADPALLEPEPHEAVRRLAHSAAVLLFTDRSEAGYLLPLLRAGAAGVVGRECAAADVAEAVRRAATGAVVLDEPLRERVHRALLAREDDGQALTTRQVTILRLVATGASNADIAARLHLSISTIKAHLRDIGGRLDTSNRAAAVARAGELGIFA